MSFPRPHTNATQFRRVAATAATLLVHASIGLLWLASGTAAQATAEPAADVLTLEEAADHLRVEVRELEALAERGAVPGRRVGSGWRFSRRALSAWLAGVDPVAVAATDIPVDSVSVDPDRKPHLDDAAAAQRTVGVEGLATPSSSLGDRELAGLYATGPEGGVAEEPATVGYPPEGKTASEIFLRQHRVLLAPGDFIIEPTFTYSQAQQREFVALTIGGGFNATFYQSTTVEDQVLGATLALRYGIFNETEIYVGSRYKAYDSSSTVNFKTGGEIKPQPDPRLGTESVVEVYFGISRTLIQERSKMPDIILSIEGSAPVKRSSGSIGAKTWLVKSFDPVVLYAGLDYRYSFGRSYENLNLLTPDHRLRATGGWAFSVNDSLTFSTSFSGTWTTETSYSNAILPSRESYSLRLGLTNMMRNGLYLEPSVTLGLSGPGNWVAFALTMPWAVTK